MGLILAGVVGVLAIVMILVGVKRGKSATPTIDERLSSFGMQSGAMTLAQREQSESFSARVIKPMVRNWSNSLGSRSPASSLEKVRVKLNQAGNPNGMGPVEFIGLRYLVAAGMGGGICLLMIFAGLGLTNGAAIGAISVGIDVTLLH